MLYSKLGEVIGVEWGAFAAEGGNVVGVGYGGEGAVDFGVGGGFGFHGQFFGVGKLDGFEQRDDVSYGGAVLGETFGGFALDAYVFQVEQEEVGYTFTHLGRDGNNLGAVHDEH